MDPVKFRALVHYLNDEEVTGVWHEEFQMAIEELQRLREIADHDDSCVQFFQIEVGDD